MGHHGVGSLLVVSSGELLGIVTDRDIVLRAVSTGQSLHAHIATIMSEQPTNAGVPQDLNGLEDIGRSLNHRRLLGHDSGDMGMQ